MVDLSNIGEAKMPSIINNPFNKISVKDITVYTRQSWSGNWYAKGSVEFENNNTTAVQSFEGKDFDEVVLKIKAFLEELK